MKSLDYFESGQPVNIVWGPKSLKAIAQLLRQNRALRPMIITDAKTDEVGLLELVLQNLGSEIEIGPVINDLPNVSDIRQVPALAGRFSKERCDSILAVGRGAVIDMAKGVNLSATEEVSNITRLCGIGSLTHCLYPLIAVPTNFGSGCEASATAVIAEPASNRKWFFTSPFLVPSATILDPRMSSTLSARTIASGAMNALSHAIEACTSLTRNPVDSANAVSAIRLIKDNMFKLITSNNDSLDDAGARMSLSLASCLAGMAISGAKASLTYALAHGVSALCHVPHGLCTAILLPYCLAHNLPKIKPIAGELLLHLAGNNVYAQTPQHLRAETLVETVCEMNQKLFDLTKGGHVTALKELNSPEGRPYVPLDILHAIAKVADNNCALLSNPVETDQADLTRILEHAWEGRRIDSPG